jgi:putative transposase
VSSFRLIDAERANYPVAMLCGMLGVSKSGYYAWRSRPPSKRSLEDAILTKKIREIHSRSRETYGYPRVHAELRSLGIGCGRRRVARLMRAAGLRGCMRGKRRRTTRRDPQAAPAPDLLGRDFVAGCPNRIWLADITYIPTQEGFLYLAFILDTHSRRIVGWSMGSRMRTELVVDALEMAVWRRRPSAGLVHHSDRGAAVYGDLVWQTPRRGRPRSFDGKDRNGPRQRDGREFHRHLEDRARASTAFPLSRGSEECHLRVPGRVLQS